eukprot:Skav228894  [mRNA]  locus=scaffold194:357205:358445:+ [translate_table: standard]
MMNECSSVDDALDVLLPIPSVSPALSAPRRTWTTKTYHWHHLIPPLRSTTNRLRGINDSVPSPPSVLRQVLLADAEGTLAQVEVGGFGAALVQRFSREQPGGDPWGSTGILGEAEMMSRRLVTGWFSW